MSKCLGCKYEYHPHHEEPCNRCIQNGYYGEMVETYLKQYERGQKTEHIKNLRRKKIIDFVLFLSVIICLVIFTVGINIIGKDLFWGLVMVLPSFAWMFFVILTDILTTEID